MERISLGSFVSNLATKAWSWVSASVFRFEGRCAQERHGYEARASKRHAQKLKAAAKNVSRIKTGSFARRGPSRKTRQICAKVINPNTVPVVIKYAFSGIGLV
jgi:hypothetical protein